MKIKDKFDSECSSELEKKAMNFAIKAHNDTNHFYDDFLPYTFHLRMVVKAAKDFIHLVQNRKQEIVFSACWNHDVIEDSRISFAQLKEVTNFEVAEIVRAVTNYGRGRTREERMPDFVYDDIRNTEFATFVKLCDRIANVQYSSLTGSSMFTKYKKEQTHFETQLRTENDIYEEMWNYLNELFVISKNKKHKKIK